VRIIAGRWGGQVIASPKGQGTRPTGEKIRGALFNVLQHQLALETRVVWDLYAGTGALGLEALSRGALQAVFVEDHGKTAQTLRHTLRHLNIPLAQAQVQCTKVENFVPQAPWPEAPLLVLLDPPYALWQDGLLLLRLFGTRPLPPGSWLVAEAPARSTPQIPQGLESKATKRYGDTQLLFMISPTDTP